MSLENIRVRVWQVFIVALTSRWGETLKLLIQYMFVLTEGWWGSAVVVAMMVVEVVVRFQESRN